MKKKILIIFLFIINLFSCNTSKETPKPANTLEIQSEHISNIISSYADSLLLDKEISAVSIGVIKNRKKYIRHYGELELGKKAAPQDNTIYAIGSLTKPVVGMLVAQAEIDGKLNINSDIRKYLKLEFPNLEYEGMPITLKHIMTHTSLLPNALPKELEELRNRNSKNFDQELSEIMASYDKAKFLKDLRHIKIDTFPGHHFNYSNVGADVIAHILENVYKTKFENLIRKNICNPAKMYSTKINLDKKENKRWAVGYDENKKEVAHEVFALWGADGGLKSTAPDLVNLMEFILYQKKPFVKKLYTENDSFYTKFNRKYFWNIGKDNQAGNYMGMHGGSPDANVQLYIFPEKDLGIMIITNQNGNNTGRKLIQALIGILRNID